MEEGKGDSFDGLSTERRKLGFLEEMHRKDIVQLSMLEIRPKIEELEAKLNADDEEPMASPRSRNWVSLTLWTVAINAIATWKDTHGVSRKQAADVVSLLERTNIQESLTMLLKQLEKEKRSLESQVKGNARRQEQELKAHRGTSSERCAHLAEMSQVSGSYLVSKRQQMDQLPRMKENLVKMGRSPINQKTMNGKRGPVKNSSISNHLPKLSL